MYSNEQVAAATGAPLANIQTQWPLVVEALQWAGIDSHRVHIGAIATIARETGVFWPIPEEGDQAYFERELGSDWVYHGRGLLQLTWSSNYRHYGDEIGVDLVANPDMALQPAISAKVLALYFKERGTAAAANAGDWQGVQTTVNGGYVNYDRYLAVVNALLAVAEPSDAPSVTTLTVDASLKELPNHDCIAVADLAKGCTLQFIPDPPLHPDGTTPHWAYCQILSGTTQKLKPASGLKGWLLRGDLATTT